MKTSLLHLSSPSRVFILISLAAVLTALAGFPLSLNMSRFRENLSWVGHTNEVLHQLSATERALLQAESSERGYLLTGDATYLSTYSTSKDLIPDLLSSLTELVADNSVQTSRVDGLRSDIEASEGSGSEWSSRPLVGGIHDGDTDNDSMSEPSAMLRLT